MTSSRATPPGAAAPPPARPAATVPAEEPPASAALFLGPLLDLSHDLAWARTEPEVCAAVASALEGLFPGRRHAVRLLDPRTLALTAIRAKGPLRQPDLPALVLGRDTARQAGLSPEALQAAGVTIAAADAPLFEGSGTVTVAPLAVAGALHGLVNLEYEPDGDQVPAADEVMLRQLANLAALGARNLRSMEELASLKTYLEDLIEHANALIAVVGRDRRVTVWNGGLTRLTGVPRGEARGRELTDFAVADERAALAALLDRSLAGEAVDGFETRLTAPGGEARVAFNTAPVRTAAGVVEAVVAIGQDLTRLRNLEAAAEQAEKMAGLGRLAAGIVHELNNPLVAVTMYAEALYEKWAFSSGATADLEKIKAIKDAGQRIQKLTRDLTAYARGGSSRPEPLDLAPLLDQAARMCKPALKEASAEVERAFAEVPQVDASKAALVQAFVNLITNASQALAPGGGHVRLGLTVAGGRVLASVRDDGAGMAPDVLARAFEPFFTTRPGRGIGLGLATARGIVERYGGTIAIESAAGQGATVTVSLPARAVDGPPRP
ncbi:MAG: PAS domain-containing protein [Anaeromyxobacter sp.]|nr:PAS domain-containing protein [Anaeromyxobacter sp.]MBL0278430.1 PAS domain-containing protein [Anaeromyxobacter sp.]